MTLAMYESTYADGLLGLFHEWMHNLSDPHEFTTAFAGWIENNPHAKGSLFAALKAIDHWERHWNLKGLTYVE